MDTKRVQRKPYLHQPESSVTHTHKCTHLHTHLLYLFLSLSHVRWLDRNEDDGQIVRELVPTDHGQRLFSECTYVHTNIITYKNLKVCNNETNKVQIGCIHIPLQQAVRFNASFISVAQTGLIQITSLSNMRSDA